MPGPIQPDAYDDVLAIDFARFWHIRTERNQVWDALEPWFQTHGYILYPRTPAGFLIPPASVLYDLCTDAVQFPHAYAPEKTSLGRMMCPAPAVFPAVNRDRRDVVIKILPSNSPELAIFKHLVTEPQRSNPMNLTVPVLDLLYYDDNYSFVVMPRWATASSLPDTGFDSLRTAFQFAMSILQVLTSLHNNGIVYRPANVLINCYHSSEFCYDFRPFFTTKQARFVLCDFNLSVMFPSDTPLANRLLPVSESEWGSPEYHPPDVANGETVYDPFAYDVACLGGVLCATIGYLTPFAPELAPFLDRMITPDIPSRYTAVEALKAFTVLKYGFSSKRLDQSVPQPPHHGTTFRWQTQDRWAGLPEAFVEKHMGVRPPVRPRRKIQFYDGTSYFVDWDAPSDEEEEGDEE
ncbi:unnamed protein product [Somion occarium]|uniref:Protein kinase domain-containing protein n=1 Tax=Somion occarium TaxID=3059160 RepID=A0ABP1CRX4_9APHY